MSCLLLVLDQTYIYTVVCCHAKLSQYLGFRSERGLNGMLIVAKNLNKENVAFLFPIYIYNFLENIPQLHSQAILRKAVFFPSWENA